MSGEDLPTCPVCGRPYEMRYSLRTFTPAMVGPDDETCRTDGFVHVHEARGLEGDRNEETDDSDGNGREAGSDDSEGQTPGAGVVGEDDADGDGSGSDGTVDGC